MSQAALSLGVQHDALLPRAPGGNGPGAVLALLVHAGLLLALTTAVDWRATTPEVVSAELWASVPQVAAPPPPAPAPVAAPAPAPTPAPAPQAEVPRPDADIAIERTRKAEAARKRAEEEAETERKRATAAAEKKRAEDDRRKALAERKQREQEEREAKAEEDRLAQQREANLRRMMGQAGGTGSPGSTGTAAQSAAPSTAYAGRLIARIRPNIVYTGDAPASATAEVEVTAAAAGTIISRQLVKSSGYKEWDEAVLRAIEKTPSLPRDTDGRVPDRLTISFRRD